MDLAKALMSAIIAFHKLENEEFKDFLEKYTKKKIHMPDQGHGVQEQGHAAEGQGETERPVPLHHH